MYIDAIGHYVPTEIMNNNYFEETFKNKEIEGNIDEWITARTGIKNRRKAGKNENSNTMAIEAVKNALERINNIDLNDIDLIIGATYSPYDLSVSIAHAVQHHFQIDNTISFSVNSGCSSLLNALETAEIFLSAGKAKKALVIASEHNTGYLDFTDSQSCHLFGDGAVAFVLSAEKTDISSAKIKNILTLGLGNVGNSAETVVVHPQGNGIGMPNGKDVFINACKYMPLSLNAVIEPFNLNLQDLTYVIPHQANLRIVANIKKAHNLSDDQMLTNIEDFGNTGCASSGLVYSQNQDIFKKGDLIGLTVFGGGYSTAAMLIEKL